MNNQVDACQPARLNKRFGALALTTLMGALLLAGCAAGPDYHAPAAAMPAAYQGQAALAAHNGALPAPTLDTWWTGFNDPALTRIIDRVLQQNLDLSAALARVDQARAVAREAGARLLPSGSLSADATRQRQRQSLQSPQGRLASSAPGYDRNQSIYNVGAGASWELDLAGGLKRGTETAGAEAQAAEADRLGVRVTVAAEAADAYFRVRGAQRRIVLAQEQVSTNTRLLELVRLRQTGGLAASREAFQAEALVSQAKATIPPLSIERDIQLNRLDVLMGAHPGTYAAELASVAPDTVVPAISSSQGPADLLRRRPDVIAAERRLAVSSARIGVATAEYYPSLSISALLGFASLGSSGLISAAAFQPQATAGLRWRLFDFGRVDADVARAKGANAEALALYRKSMLRATEDVENAVVTLTQLEVQYTDLSQQVSAETQARDASQEAYKGGAVSLYEVLEEDRQLLAARDQLARVDADKARAAVAAFRALGGGW
jgi:NodT family efflux transporter outer membrane factor (OMF) lipoprotein